MKSDIRQGLRLPRASILAESLQHLRCILVNSIDEAVEISNRYAPEHLILVCDDPEQMADKVTAAGSVFIGPWTPESLGDYCSGTNHVLPTYGYARAYSGLSVIATIVAPVPAKTFAAVSTCFR